MNNLPIVFTFLFVFLPGLAQAKTGNCSLDHVSISYTDDYDYDLACEAITRTTLYLQQYGDEPSNHLSIHFADNVFAYHYDENYEVVASERVVGFFDKNVKEIWFTGIVGLQDFNFLAFGALPLTREIYISMLSHEIAHWFLYSKSMEIFGEPMDRATHEFFAYTTQIATLKEQTREKLLHLWKDEKFEDNEGINSFVYLSSPHRFAVMAYKYSLTSGSVKQILDGRFLSGDYLIAQDEPNTYSKSVTTQRAFALYPSTR